MPKTARLLAAVVALAGCAAAPLVATKSDMSSFKQDNYACTQESRVSFGGAGLGLVAAQVDARRESRKLYTMCMEARGYDVTEQR
jgi:hypothetical protein